MLDELTYAMDWEIGHGSLKFMDSFLDAVLINLLVASVVFMLVYPYPSRDSCPTNPPSTGLRVTNAGVPCTVTVVHPSAYVRSSALCT